MNQIELIAATKEDVHIVHELQNRAFMPLYEKYHDDETSPAKETIARTEEKILDTFSEYYLIRFDNKYAGAVRVARKKTKHENNIAFVQDVCFISPLFIVPEYQNRGIGYQVIQMLFEKYQDTVEWVLYTIKQEKGNCHLYEKCGFMQVGEEKQINDTMSLVKYEKSMVNVRRFENRDAKEVSNLICRNFREVNVKDYGEKAMNYLAASYDENRVLQIAGSAHMYVFEFKDKIVGVGSISSFWGSETESILLTVFVLPELHKKGIGRKIIETLEKDNLFLRAERIEIPASITGVEFYRKLGYDYKNGVQELDSERHYRLEKYRKVSAV